MPTIPATATAQILTITAASAPSAALVEGQRYRVATSTNCWVKFGTAPVAAVATTDNHYLAAGQVLCFAAIGLGTAPKVAIIRDTADGSASISLSLD